MRAMILAAGRGQRMGALTDKVPKPLLKVANRYLIEYAIDALVKAGIKEIVINISYHADQIKKALGSGKRYGVKFLYSEEKNVLETGGGILNALPLLGKKPFIVVSADIISDYPLAQLPTKLTQKAHLVLVNNPPFHLQGDFALTDSTIYLSPQNTLTFANMGIYHPRLFTKCEPGKFPLGHLLKNAIENNIVTGEHYQGRWFNIGTPEDLAYAESVFG